MATALLNGNGVLPVGLHEMTLEEVDRLFGRFTTTDRRQVLFANLKEYCAELRKVGFVDYVLVNGSFVTSKAVPGDIDMIVVLKPGTIPSDAWNPYDRNLVSRRWVLRKYEIEIAAVRPESEEHRQYLEVFSQVKEAPGLQKGLVRLVL